MRALITGGAGFVGQHLARALVRRGDAVVAVGLHAESARWILSDDERGAVEWMTVDFRDGEQVDRAVAAARPDAIFHLAGISFPPDADRAPDAAYDVNMLGAVRLLAAVRRHCPAGPVVVVVGSAVQYGRHDDAEMPLDEQAELRPATVYAASKAAQEMVARQAFRQDGSRVICVRAASTTRGSGTPSTSCCPSLVATGARGARRRLREPFDDRQRRDSRLSPRRRRRECLSFVGRAWARRRGVQRRERRWYQHRTAGPRRLAAGRRDG